MSLNCVLCLLHPSKWKCCLHLNGVRHEWLSNVTVSLLLSVLRAERESIVYNFRLSSVAIGAHNATRLLNRFTLYQYVVAIHLLRFRHFSIWRRAVVQIHKWASSSCIRSPSQQPWANIPHHRCYSSFRVHHLSHSDRSIVCYQNKLLIFVHCIRDKWCIFIRLFCTQLALFRRIQNVCPREPFGEKGAQMYYRLGICPSH